MNVIDLPIKSLKPYKNNPRNNAAAVEFVKNSIAEFGFRVPVVIDKEKTIVCGHTRYLAAQELKLDKIPCVIADDLDEEQIKAFRLVDNKTQELSEWDWDAVFEELNLISGIDMKLMGFEEFLNEDKGEMKERKIGENEEIDLDSFSDEEFSQVCPCCGFRFND